MLEVIGGQQESCSCTGNWNPFQLSC